MGTIYLLHFSEKYKRVQHYVGYADHDLMARLDEHAKTLWERWAEPVADGNGHVKAGEKHGDGALLLGVINALGIGFQLVRTWQGGRDLEKHVKAMKCAPCLCPVCNPNAANRLVGHASKIHIEV